MNEYILTLSLGLLVSLILYDVLSIAAGGIVVPGYTAYMLHQPLLLAISLVAGLLAYVGLTGIGKFTILYGRRRFVLAILLGVIANFLVMRLFSVAMGRPAMIPDFGFVVPGLLATWLDKQGIVATTSVLCIATAATGLIVMFLRSWGV